MSDSSDEQAIERAGKDQVEGKSASKRRMTHIGLMFGDTMGPISKKNPPYTQHSEGINLYLRLGTVGKSSLSLAEITTAVFSHWVCTCTNQISLNLGK